MRRNALAVALGLLAGLTAGPGVAQVEGTDTAGIVAAVGDSGRPLADVERDKVRKPAQTLAFAQVRAGDRIGEYMPGGGYFTRVMARSVAPKGRVYAFVPSEIVKLVPKYRTDAEAIAAAYGNVTVILDDTARFGAPEPLDLVFTAQNYHDLHGRLAPPEAAKAFNAAVFKALKPGGVYLIIDHAAEPGSGLRDADARHRIDPAAIRVEVEAAGFRFEAEADFLRAPTDDRGLSVFDPAIRGRTDQFIHRYRKPG